MKITFADGNVATIEELRNDVEAARNKYHYRDFCFTYVTVEGLINALVGVTESVSTKKALGLGLDLAALKAHQAQLRARYFLNRITTGAWRDDIGTITSDGSSLTERQALELAFHKANSHLELAENLLESAVQLTAKG